MGNNIAPSRRAGEETMRITVMTIAGKVLALDVRATDTVGRVKAKIHGKLGLRVPPSRQRLVFEGKVLGHDGRTLADYGVREESSCLHLAILRGREGWMKIFLKLLSWPCDGGKRD